MDEHAPEFTFFEIEALKIFNSRNPTRIQTLRNQNAPELAPPLSHEKKPAELPEISATRLSRITPLGSGSFGSVVRAEWQRHSSIVLIALKQPLSSDAAENNIYSEINLMHGLKHPNLIGLYGVVKFPSLALVMELADCTLRSFLNLDTPILNLKQIIQIAQQITAGMVYLSDHAIVHRDLKSENIVLLQETAKIIDFDQARLKNAVHAKHHGYLATEEENMVGTPAYLAPEIIAPPNEVRIYDQFSDVYALVLIFIEMLSKKITLIDSSSMSIIYLTGSNPEQRRQIELAALNGYSPPEAYRNIIARGLDPNPFERPMFRGIQSELDASMIEMTGRALSFDSLFSLQNSLTEDDAPRPVQIPRPDSATASSPTFPIFHAFSSAAHLKPIIPELL